MNDTHCTSVPVPGRVVLTAACVCALLSACAPGAPAPSDARAVSATLDISELLGGADTLHARAVEPRPFAFPADHGPHPDFRTEWWYFTGNVTARDGRELGYQLTFFRSALTDSVSYSHTVEVPDGRSPWRARHAYMAHLAVSDITGAAFYPAQRFARDAIGLAGAQAQPLRVWLDAWHAESEGAQTFPLRLVAADGDVAIDLVLTDGKPPVLQGDGGLSRKGPEPGNASYYYSYTHMPTSGTTRIGDTTFDVSGLSWLDREWSTSVLSPDIEGWDWMALQLADSTELMLYRLRRPDGSAGPFSAGRFVHADGSDTPLAVDDFAMTPTRSWRSPRDGTAYPVAWRVEVPSLELDVQVTAAFDAQEMNLAVRYWEGAVRIVGERRGRAVDGRGYLEMTGY